MRGKLAPIALSVGLLGLVGGVAAAQAFHGPTKSAVRLVQPAAQTVTVTPTPTTTAAVAPRPVKVVKAVASVQSTSSTPATVASSTTQAAPVSTDTSTTSATAAPEPVKKREDAVPGVVTDPPQVIGIPTTDSATPTPVKKS